MELSTSTWHSELLPLPSVCESQEYVDSTMDDQANQDHLEDMICDVGAESFAQAHGYECLSSDAKTLSYLGSTHFIQLS